MKLFAVLALTTSAFDPTEDGDRRWDETVAMLNYYNPSVSPKGLTGYGCNCFAFGDRPMSGPTDHPGAPVDDIDTICQSFKQCVKCAREKHGDGCLPEFTGSISGRYQMTVPSAPGGEITCTNRAGTCKRDLCECSKMFARQFRNIDWSTTYKQSNNLMYGFDGATECIASGSRVTPDHQCCQVPNHDGPFMMYNANAKNCCADGSIVSFGESCPQ